MSLKDRDKIEFDEATWDLNLFLIDINGFEGPLHLLLELSRSQKVDLLKVSLLELVEQYLGFIEKTKSLKIEIAADYLIMAAYLLYLKSKLLLPADPMDNQLSAKELSESLKFQLIRLDAMRNSAIKLMARDQLGREFFSRGEEEVFPESREISYEASMIDLLQAYARLKTKDIFEPLHLKRSVILSPDEALENLNRLIDRFLDWTSFEQFLPDAWKDSPVKRRTAIATNFSVSLELARVGKLEMRQDEIFAPIFLRKNQNSINLG
jgi:segregation and condensation protein A